MSLSRQVKTFFTISSLIFTYIIWAMASTIILKSTTNYKVYIISLSSVFLMQYLVEKRKISIFQLLIPFFTAIVINALVFNAYSAICNSLYILTTLIFFKKLEDEQVDYELYKARVKTFIFTLIFLGAILPLVNRELASSILRFYLIYLVTAVIVLREVRRFSSKIANNKSLYVNLAIVFSVIFLSMDKVYNFLMLIFSSIWVGVDFALTKITMGIIYILTYIYIIIEPIFNYLTYLVKNGHKPLEPEIPPSEAMKMATEQYSANAYVILFITLLKITIVIIILYLMYRAFDSYVNKSSNDKDGEIQKEKIVRENKRIKHSYLSRFSKFFKGEGDFKSQVLNVYLKFEQKMSDKEIYKAHMTAGQLSTIAKTQIDDSEAINSITNIYNEAKFSKHVVSGENVKIAKLNYESVKEILKKKL